MTTETMNVADKAKEFFSGKLDFTIGPLELNQQIDKSENIMVIDVRAAEDFIKGHVPRAINLPEGNWEKIGKWRGRVEQRDYFKASMAGEADARIKQVQALLEEFSVRVYEHEKVDAASIRSVNADGVPFGMTGLKKV